MIRKTLTDGNELTFEEHEAARRRIRAAAERPYVPDPDCPLLTEEQLAEFRPVSGMSMEERMRLMADVCQRDGYTIETDLTDEEKAIIAAGDKEYQEHPENFVSMDSVNWN